MTYRKTIQPYATRGCIEHYQDDTGKQWLTREQFIKAMLLCRRHLDRNKLERKRIQYAPRKYVTLFHDPVFSKFYQDRDRVFLLKKELKLLR